MTNSPKFSEKFETQLGEPEYTAWVLTQLSLSEYAVYRALLDLKPANETLVMAIKEVAAYLQIAPNSTTKYLTLLKKKKFIAVWSSATCVGQSHFYWIRTKSLEEIPRFIPSYTTLVDPEGKQHKLYLGNYSRFARKNGLSRFQISRLLNEYQDYIIDKNGGRWTRYRKTP
jgi:DNA-binding MarR family transcriptional regulator